VLKGYIQSLEERTTAYQHYRELRKKYSLYREGKVIQLKKCGCEGMEPTLSNTSNPNYRTRWSL